MPLDIPELARFEEGLFPPVSADVYWARVTAGYQQMLDLSVAITGLVRDLAYILPTTIQRLEQLGSLFGSYHVVIYENDSVDESRQLLQAWEKTNPNVTVISECLQAMVNPKKRCLARADRMAGYRNRCRQHVVDYLGYTSHTIVADMDLGGGWSYDGIAHTFGAEDWDFVGSNGLAFRANSKVPIQYDAWAFRKYGSYVPLNYKQVNPLHWERGAPMVPVYSCFGGLGIYRMPAMLTCAYDGTDCEHVPFHRRMREKGLKRLFLNPSQIVIY